jgi:hypothetical protein
MKYILDYDLARYTKKEVRYIEARILYHRGRIFHDPCYVYVIRTKFALEEDRDDAKKEIDAYIDIIEEAKKLKFSISVDVENIHEELPCQELMSR